MELSEADRRALKKQAGITQARITKIRRDAQGYPDRLIEGIGPDEITLFRGWWNEGESASDIKWEEPWHTSVLTADQVAERLGVAQSTVRNWCADGVLKAWKPTPRSAWLVNEADLAEFEPPKVGRPAKEK